VANGEEDCSNPGSTLKDALAQDRDLPLSLMQVKAVATRNNATRHNQTPPADQNIVFAHMTQKNPSAVKTGMFSSETLHVFYICFVILILVLIVNFSLLAGQFRRQEDKQKQSVPTIKLPVDHLIATSKLDLGVEPAKNQLHLYTRAKDSIDSSVQGRCPSRASSRNPFECVASAGGVKSEQLSTKEKPRSTGEALDLKLILPLRETWYAVSIEQYLQTDGSFEILRITGCPSLRAGVCYTGNGGTLELFCGSAGANHLIARATVREPNMNEWKAAGPLIELMGAGGRDLGELRSISSKSFELACGGEMLASLTVDDAGQLEFFSASGTRLACVSCLAGHLGICVNAGADTGLIVCLVLAAVLLGGAAEHVLPKTAKSGIPVRSDEDTCEQTSPMLDAS